MAIELQRRDDIDHKVYMANSSAVGIQDVCVRLHTVNGEKVLSLASISVHSRTQPIFINHPVLFS